jgi:transposase InsO family protein
VTEDRFEEGKWDVSNVVEEVDVLDQALLGQLEETQGRHRRGGLLREIVDVELRRAQRQNIRRCNQKGMRDSRVWKIVIAITATRHKELVPRRQRPPGQRPTQSQASNQLCRSLDCYRGSLLPMINTQS